MKNNTHIVIIGLIVLWGADTSAESFNNDLKQDYFLQMASDVKLNPEIRIAYYDSLRNISKGDIRYVFAQGDLFWDMGLYARALKLYEETRSMIPDDSLRLRLHHSLRIACAYHYSSQPVNAIREAYSMLTINKPDSLLYLDVEVNRLLFHIFSGLDHKTRHIYLERASEKFKSFEKSEASQYLKDYTLGKLYQSYSGSKIMEKDYTGAFEDLKIARDFLGRYGKASSTALNMGVIYFKNEEYDMAKKYYLEAMAMPSYHPDHLIAVINYCALLGARGDYDGARNLMLENEENLKKLIGTPWEWMLYHTIYILDKRTGNVEKADRCLEKAYNLKDSLYNYLNNLYLANLFDEYEGTDWDSVNRRLTESVRQRDIWIWILGVMCMLLIGLAMVMEVRKRGRDRKLEEMSREVGILRDDNEEYRMRMEESLGDRSRKLSAMTMQMMSLNECLYQIENTIKDKKLNRDELVSKMNKSLKSLHAHENVWEMFRIYFEEVNQKFFDNLFQVAPNLTKAEVRMCAFMLTGMTTKEIAAVTNRSVRTVDCIKYNLKRKLNIDEPTEAFIRRLSAGITTT